MRTLALVGAFTAIAAVVLGFTFLGDSSARGGRPVLRLVSSTPLKVKGEHFRAREHVRITARTHRTSTTAGPNGVFIVTIPGATRCDRMRVVAVGSAGSYAVLKTLPAPACLPARSHY
jgi:hypothetical protein